MRLHICNLIAAGWENNLGLAIGMKLVFKELGCKIGIGGVYTPNAGALTHIYPSFLLMNRNGKAMNLLVYYYSLLCLLSLNMTYYLSEMKMFKFHLLN